MQAVIPRMSVTRMNTKISGHKNEIFSVLGVLVVIFLANFVNFRISQRKERDTQRDLDVSAIALGIEKYKKDYGFYPTSSSDGKIIACRGPETKRENPFEIPKEKKAKLINLVPCRWGVDALMDITDINYPHYISLIPKDPQQDMGARYRYISDGASFQILGAFEGKDIVGYNQDILARDLSCGIRICNFGKASLNTPLEKSI